MRRLIHFFALAALAFAPTAMHRAEAAPSHRAAATADHCSGTPQRSDHEDRGRSADCAIACSAMPCTASLAAPAQLPRVAFDLPPAPFFAGTAPGSDPPPPRPS